MNPIVTVIIPTYNRSNYLQIALNSVLSQTFTDSRILISNNASTDDTAAVIARYDDPRIQVIHRPENVGWLNNFNLSLAEVETEFVTILCDDDVMRPEALELGINAMRRWPTAGIVHSSFDVIDEDGRVTIPDERWARDLNVDTLESGITFIGKSLGQWCRACAPAVMIRTSSLPPVGYLPEDDPYSDQTLWLRIALHHDVGFVLATRIALRIHAGADSARWGHKTDSGFAPDWSTIRHNHNARSRFLKTHRSELRKVRALQWQSSRLFVAQAVSCAVGPRVSRLMRSLRRFDFHSLGSGSSPETQLIDVSDGDRGPAATEPDK